MDNYFDLTIAENDIDSLTVHALDRFNCSLKDKNSSQIYKGFILAKSPEGNRLTVCEVDFQRSGTDGKYQPRLTFRRVDPQLNTQNAPSNARNIRMPFAHGEDGYREFWKMIFFLYGFKETVDFGNFHNDYQLISTDQFKNYMNDKTKEAEVAQIAGELGVDVSEVLRTRSTITLLKSYQAKLQEFISNNASETDVQNWLDEDGSKYRQQRCLIFGLEYIDFKREGNTSGKRFDVLTRVGSKYIDHVLIELKSPSADIFKIDAVANANGGTSSEYNISKELSRAIPQILEYKSTLESKPAGDPELERLGVQGQIHVGKCIIVIGKHDDDSRWLQNRKNLVKSLGATLEIWTYTELLDKLTATIENLERISHEDENTYVDTALDELMGLL
jgi:hypothetical protein